VVDSWRNADGAESRHRRSGCTSPSGTVNSCYQLEKHSVGDVEREKFIIQAAVRLPSAGGDARSRVQHTL